MSAVLRPAPRPPRLRWRPCGPAGYAALYLGTEEVGRVRHELTDHGPCAEWLFRLGPHGCWIAAANGIDAKPDLLAALAAWLDRADLPDIARQVREARP